MIAAPPARRRLVGAALRRYREDLGYTLDDAARVLCCDRSKVSRIETGQRGVHVTELRAMLTEYGAGEQARDALAAIADHRGGRGWWRAYAAVLPDAWQDYLALESAASAIEIYAAQQVPGLLQTRAYARALAGADPALGDDDARERAVEATLARQKALLGGSRPGMHVIIGEAALRQRVGGPQVMEGQLGLVAGLTGDSGPVTVQVLPFGCGAHPAAGAGSLSILHFAAAPGLGAVHLGGARGGVCLEGQEDVAACTAVFGLLRQLALGPAKTALLLRGQKAA
jgi:transcriptional regulator with XRE-family HTH domain